jgi:hypothetical protein
MRTPLLVHRVDGLEPGPYILGRDPDAPQELKHSLRQEWLWQRTGPDDLALHFLLPYDLRGAAKVVCCRQDIGADSCAAQGMIARSEIALRQPWRYRRLFWDCGHARSVALSRPGSRQRARRGHWLLV